jgi:hypothetical protein
MRRVVAKLERSVRAHPRAMYVLYHNPLLEHVLNESGFLHKISGTHQYSVFRFGGPADPATSPREGLG